MKELIDIPKDDYELLKYDNRQDVITLSCSLRNVITNGTPIPDNATNGDVIKTMFPDIYSYCGGGKFGFIQFNLDWWNTPYKESE